MKTRSPRPLDEGDVANRRRAARRRIVGRDHADDKRLCGLLHAVDDDTARGTAVRLVSPRPQSSVKSNSTRSSTAATVSAGTVAMTEALRFRQSKLLI